jgi:Ca2+:H+ antiporter
MNRLHTLVPVLALGTWLIGAASPLLQSAVGLSWAGCMLVLAVLSAVHHAEVVAHRTGEPLGTLVLALSVTVIEVALILSMMTDGNSNPNSELARDTLFSAVMIICNGVIGLCLFLGGLQHREQSFRVEGVGPALSALVALTTLALVLPSFTTSSSEGTYTHAQLLFVALTSSTLWLVFTFFQTVRHRDYFLPQDHREDEAVHAQPPTQAQTAASVVALLASLVSVVGLAKLLSPSIERTLSGMGAPPAALGIVIAMLVLLPETLAAVLAARANRLQTSLNLALGSALASIGLTVPAVAVAAILLDLPLTLGLASKDLVLLVLTFSVCGISLVHGRTSMMQGAVHLVVFAAFAFLALVP